MRKGEKILLVVVIVPIAAFAIYTVIIAYHIPNPKVIPDAIVQKQFRRETTFAAKGDIQTKVNPVSLDEIISETMDFNQVDVNTNEGRRTFCVDLFREAGYEPVTTESGDVLVIKQGLVSDYVAVGAHYDKAEGPTRGILDNMLGCILISDIAEAFRNESTNFTYLFLTYTNEEPGRKIGSATYNSGLNGRPVYVIEIDYVGDKNADLGGRWLEPIGGRFQKTGIKITTYPMPDPPSIHTERDNITNVDFDKAYLSYKTVISMIEGIEDSNELIPPDTVNFWRKDKPLSGN
jgi:hypothetical protein